MAVQVDGAAACSSQLPPAPMVCTPRLNPCQARFGNRSQQNTRCLSPAALPSHERGLLAVSKHQNSEAVTCFLEWGLGQGDQVVLIFLSPLAPALPTAPRDCL